MDMMAPSALFKQGEWELLGHPLGLHLNRQKGKWKLIYIWFQNLTELFQKIKTYLRN